MLSKYRLAVTIAESESANALLAPVVTSLKMQSVA